MGVGQADQFWQVFSGGEGGVGENMYFELLVSVGPRGLLAFLVWLARLLWRMATVRRRAPPVWMVVGTWVALLGYLASAMFSVAADALHHVGVRLAGGWVVRRPRAGRPQLGRRG